MQVVDYMTLISGRPYEYHGLLVYPPTLDDIAAIRYQTYESYLSIFFLSAMDIGAIIGVQNESLPPTTTALQLITCIPDLRDALLRSLSFFIREEILYSDEFGYYSIRDSGIKYIAIDDIREIRSIILQLCNIQDTAETQPVKFRNEKARQIYEKIQKKKAERQAKSAFSKDSLSMTLPNLISAVSACSPTYNYFNIWQMTVYQFYDQFARLNDNLQLQIFGHRWAAWGTDNFDFSVWYRPLHTN